jgi:putative phage-type endonuclease
LTDTSNPHQRTDEWFAERKGKLTASSFGQAAGLGPASRQQLWRRHFGLETFEGNEATQWGEQKEPVALAAFKEIAATEVALTGFVVHPDHGWLGGSPDGLIGADGLLEIKCPFSQRIPEAIPAHYMAQAQGLMEITGRAWCDFFYWTPDCAWTARIERSPEYWDWLHLRLADFWVWVQAGVEPPRDKKVAPPDTSHLVRAGERTLLF